MVSKTLAGVPEAETVQHPQVEVGAVHHQLGSRQRIEQRSQIEVGQRIDQFVGVCQAHLYEADLLVVASAGLSASVSTPTRSAAAIRGASSASAAWVSITEREHYHSAGRTLRSRPES